MESFSQVIDHVEHLCKVNGTRLTTKRKAALSLLVKSGKALSAYELMDAYKTETGAALPAMSMYRILDFLVAEHFVHKLDLVNKYVVCEHIVNEGEHVQAQFLICAKCQKVKEIRMSKDLTRALQKNIKEAGFHLESRQLELNCICEQCLEQNI